MNISACKFSRTRLQKRKSDDLEGKADSDTKRQCTESKPASEEKRRSARLSGKKSTAKESPEDADAENSDVDDADVSRANICSVYVHGHLFFCNFHGGKEITICCHRGNDCLNNIKAFLYLWYRGLFCKK